MGVQFEYIASTRNHDSVKRTGDHILDISDKARDNAHDNAHDTAHEDAHEEAHVEAKGFDHPAILDLSTTLNTYNALNANTRAQPPVYHSRGSV